MQQNITIDQITDSHLFADPNRTMFGINTLASFHAVLDAQQALSKKTPADLLLLTGDLSQDETEAAYVHLSKAFNGIKTPTAFIPGNHDDATLMTTIFKNPPFTTEKRFSFTHWDVLLLNSQWPGKVEGRLDDAALQQLEETCQSNKALLIVLHHPIALTDADWLNDKLLTNHEAMWTILSRAPQVKAVLSGHVHQATDKIQQHIRLLTSPATAIQFKTNVKTFNLDTEMMPGFRRLILKPSGELETEVIRIPYDPRFVADPTSKGY